jgi:hypothetical protein
LFFRFGGDLFKDIPINARITILLDLDDLARITAEGQEGWVTYWVDIEYGISIGLNPLPLGAGFIGAQRETNIDDPRRTGRVKLLTHEVLGATLFGISVTEHGIENNSLQLLSLTSDFSKFTLISTTWNLHRGEIQLRTLLNHLGNSFQKTGMIVSFPPIALALYKSMFRFDNFKQIIESGPRELYRSFTSSDAPVQMGNRLSIRNVYGGIDIDSDGRRDNYVPFSDSERGKPSVYYPLSVRFFSDDLQEKDLKIVVSGVPEGWVIESLTADGKPPLLNKDTYPVKNAAPWTLYGTDWHIGCLSSAIRNASVFFTLYESKVLGDVFLDEVRVDFGFPKIKINPGILELLLEE